MSALTYSSRATTHPTEVGRNLLSIIAEKQTNLCVSLDLADTEKILSLLDSTSSWNS